MDQKRKIHLEPIISEHIFESIERKNLPLKELSREECEDLLKRRLLVSGFLKRDHPFYSNIRINNPYNPLQRILKIDSDVEKHPYIYGILVCPQKYEQKMISIDSLNAFSLPITFGDIFPQLKELKGNLLVFR